MKYCPVCGTTYDEEVIRFCTKDGTPLIDGTPPVFTEMPSESTGAGADDDFGDETVIRRKPPVQSSDTQPIESPPPDTPITYDDRGRSERIVIPTEHPPVQQVRPRPAQAYVPPPPPNTARTVVLTVLGTLAVLGLGAAMFWALQSGEPANTSVNINANQSTNLNTNLAFDSNFNFNAATPANSNANVNIDSNFNSSIPAVPLPSSSPRPSPTPSPIRTVLPTPSDEIDTRPTPPTPTPSSTRPAVNANTTPQGTPRIGPRPPPIGNRTPSRDNSNR